MKDGMTYAPKGKPMPVVEKGTFAVAATALEHGHIYGMCNGLKEAGADIKYVYDPDPEKVKKFTDSFPEAKSVDSLEQILDAPEIKLVAAAAIPNERGPLGIRVMEAGKDYFTDKTPFTELKQLDAARDAVKSTGRKYMVYYSERLHVECAVYASTLIEAGAVGKVVQVIGLGPHRLGAPSGRPDWFYKKHQYGGILCDIGSHQCEQFLHYCNCSSATVSSARVANCNHPDFPELEDFGEASLVGDNGTSFYYRVDWFTPDGLSAWGDGRTLILGTDGFIEMRKYVDIAREKTGDNLYLVNSEGEQHMNLRGKVGFPFFGQLILDCIHRTENAMTQEHAFLAAELCLKCQETADRNQ